MISIFTSTNSFKLLLFSSKGDDKITFYLSKICGRPSQRVDNSSFRQPNHPIQERKKVNLTSQLSERAHVYTRNILCWCGYFVGVGGERKRKCLCCKYPMIRKRILFIHCVSCQQQKFVYTKKEKVYPLWYRRIYFDIHLFRNLMQKQKCDYQNMVVYVQKG